MDWLLYSEVKRIKEELLFSDYYNSENVEEIKNYLLSAGKTTTYQSLDEVLAIVVELNAAKNRGNETYLKDRLTKEFSQMEPDKLKDIIKGYVDNNVLDKNVLGSFPSSDYFINIFNGIESEEEKHKLIGEIDISDLARYIDESGDNGKDLMRFISKTSDIIAFDSVINACKNPHAKFEMIVHKEEYRGVWISKIEDSYHRYLLIDQLEKPFEDEPEEVLEKKKVYDRYKEELEKIEDEREKAIYISKIEDKHIKDILLSKIESKENRELIINSYSRKVDDELKEVDELAQKMIREYFEDTLGEDFTEEKREILDRLLKSTDVILSELEEGNNGRAYSCGRRIVINEKNRNYFNLVLGSLIHEYSHILSGRDFPYIGERNNKTMEEGMADVFADLVVNHYLKKHEKVELNGKPFRVSNPYQTPSDYHYEAAFPRTILAGLESKGKDKKAVGEYCLGSKTIFAEMAFGKENVSRRHKTDRGTPSLDTNIEELYYSPELDFSNINRNSIYYKRNYFLPAYEIQQRLGGQADILAFIEPGGKAMAPVDALNKLLNGKRFFEVPKEELKEAMDLLWGQIAPGNIKSPVSGVTNLAFVEMVNTTEEDMDKHSFEILDNLPALMKKEQAEEPQYIMEQSVERALVREIKKIREGQSKEETHRKKEALVERLRSLFPKSKKCYLYINEMIDDFEFECDEQIAKQVEKDKEDEAFNI